MDFSASSFEGAVQGYPRLDMEYGEFILFFFTFLAVLFSWFS